MNSTTRRYLLGMGAAFVGLTCTLVATGAPESQWVSTFQNAYPNSQTDNNVINGTGNGCLICHGTNTDNFNDYGWRLRQSINQGMSITQALGVAEPDDSDMDPTGSSNLTEIDSDTQPGWTDGPNNTIHFDNGGTQMNVNPPSGILGNMDPVGTGPATAFCFGDGAGTPCPCANHSAPGDGEGCRNSSGSGGLLEASGSDSVAADDLEFAASNLLSGQPALLFVGDIAINGGTGVAFGDGLRCAGQNVVRLGVDTPDAAGQASWGPGLGALGGWAAGNTRRFQGWYRNPGGPCGNGFNLTNGLEVSFTP